MTKSTSTKQVKKPVDCHCNETKNCGTKAAKSKKTTDCTNCK